MQYSLEKPEKRRYKDNVDEYYDDDYKQKGKKEKKPDYSKNRKTKRNEE
jgi:hypothetical protein